MDSSGTYVSVLNTPFSLLICVCTRLAMCGGGSSSAHTPPKISGSNCDARTNRSGILRKGCFWMAMWMWFGGRGCPRVSVKEHESMITIFP